MKTKNVVITLVVIVIVVSLAWYFGFLVPLGIKSAGKCNLNGGITGGIVPGNYHLGQCAT